MAGTRQRPRVLVVAYCFPPYAAIGTMRTLRVVRQLDARGWDVTVLTSDPRTFRPSTIVDEALLSSVPAQAHIVRAASFRPMEQLQRAINLVMVRPEQATVRVSDPGVAGVTRQARRSPARAALVRTKDLMDAALGIPDQESGWLLPAIARGALHHLRSERPDVIYSSAPPWTGQLVAAALKQALRRPWVADFRDPWARAPWRADRYPFALRAAARLERFVVNRADRVVFVAAGNRDEFVRHYGASAASRFALVQNGCDPAEFDALRSLGPVAHDPFVLLHAGSLYAGRTPVPLLNALAAAIADRRIQADRFRLRFLGSNAIQGTDLIAACRALGLERVVEFLPRVPREQSLQAMMSASGLLLLQPGHTVSVPGKVYEYLATGRPIFAIAEEGETADLVRRTAGGVSVTPDDEGAIADALVSMVANAGSTFAPPPRELYDGNIGATQIARILESVIEAPGSHARLADVQVKP
jgi:glycosyltransferase involved in cell wall biosynthesis